MPPASSPGPRDQPRRSLELEIAGAAEIFGLALRVPAINFKKCPAVLWINHVLVKIRGCIDLVSGGLTALNDACFANLHRDARIHQAVPSMQRSELPLRTAVERYHYLSHV